jgi:NAD(P)-dependent dehydrogenase (short-subunit alcohol dehydrogenase family)
MAKIILITGSSDGIGAATAMLAAEKGFYVCVNYRGDNAAAEKIVERIRIKGGKALSIKADVSVESDVLAMFKYIDQEVGRITALVNNAGIIEPGTSFTTITVDRLTRLFAVNVTGSFLCAREAVKRMKGYGGGIVNISSAAARLGGPFEYVDYAASKGAIDTMTIGLSKEVAADNIRVNALRPGLIHTKIHAKGGDPDRVQKLENQIPMKRGGQAEEVAAAALWLLSDEASYVTGTIIDVTGGR